MSGWYRLHRGWQQHAVFRSEPFSRRDAFVWLIENACYEPGKVTLPGGVVTLERGQLAHSLRFLAKAWKWDEARVRRFLTALRQAQIIDASTDAGQTVITVCNYGKYQDRQSGADAPGDAEPTQQRRGGDAKKKEGEEGKVEEARARDGGYAFEGATVRLNQRHLDEWQRTFHAIPDLRAELSSIDSWWAAQDAAARKDWFQRTKRMLNSKHQQMLTKAGQASGAAIHTIDEAFERRLARFQAGQGK